MFALTVADGPHCGRRLGIRSGGLIIGRGSDCQLRASSRQVSRKHCRLWVHDQQLWVQDLGSANGTWVNDQPVTAEHLLYDQDRLRIGPLEFIVRQEWSAGLEDFAAELLLQPSSRPPVRMPESTTVTGGKVHAILAQYKSCP